MKLFRRPLDRPARRGQALVEFALILPLLALLLVMAIDLGRVFFGWIALQNGARVAADFAASNAESWPDDQALYRALVVNDMQTINCRPAPDANGNGAWDVAEVPNPVFVDVDGNGEVRNDGDYAHVTLQCDFDVLTPLASSLVGSPITFRAEADFAINQILVPAVPTPEPTPPGPCPGPTASFDLEENPAQGDATDGEGTSPLVVDFTDTSTQNALCPITSWEWDFQNDGVVDSTQPDPSGISFVHTGSPAFRTYSVELTVTTDDDLTDSATATIRVRRP